MHLTYHTGFERKSLLYTHRDYRPSLLVQMHPRYCKGLCLPASDMQVLLGGCLLKTRVKNRAEGLFFNLIYKEKFIQA